jgi:phenylacetate-CoA ligase
VVVSLASALVAKDLFERRERAEPASVRRILRHARATVPFYASMPAGAELADFPLIERSVLSERPDEFISRAFERSSLAGKSTSGSTGVPLTVFRDLASLYAFAHDTLRRFFGTFPELRPARPFAHETVVVNDNSLLADHVFVSPAVAFSRHRFSVLGKSDRRDGEIARLLAKERAQLLIGRPRGLLRLGEIAAREGVSLRPRAVVSGGDNLYDADRAEIERTFGAPVYNSYGSVEAGVIALECRRERVLHVLADRAYCEVLSDDGALAHEGYGQLVNTNLENFGMCFPRYVTGDLVRLVRGRCPCGFEGQTVASIDGRISIYFYIGGRRYNPAELNKLFERYPVKQFRLTQIGDAEFTLEIITRAAAQWDAATCDALLAELRGRLGNVEITVLFPERIGEPGTKVHRYSTAIRPMAAR